MRGSLAPGLRSARPLYRRRTTLIVFAYGDTPAPTFLSPTLAPGKRLMLVGYRIISTLPAEFKSASAQSTFRTLMVIAANVGCPPLTVPKMAEFFCGSPGCPASTSDWRELDLGSISANTTGVEVFRLSPGKFSWRQ